jgi:hypothetical protein
MMEDLAMRHPIIDDRSLLGMLSIKNVSSGTMVA